MKKYQELKIQYLSQENDSDLLIKQIIYHKKENQRIRDTHFKLKKQVDKIKEAEKAEEASLKFERERAQKGILKPGTAGTMNGVRGIRKSSSR